MQEALRRKETGERAMEGRDFVSGLSPAMLTLEAIVEEIAPTRIPVLLIGESGTGKQMLAHRIHALSASSQEALLKITCSSITPEALSAQMGGCTADGEKKSKNSVGTVLFDEIGELDSACQRILMQALPDGDAKPSAGVLTARIISTTSRNLEHEMQAQRFRSELYYRIGGVCLQLPPLREHKEDIPLLADLFLAKHAARLDRPRPSLSPRTLRLFLRHNWPGNVRELDNVAQSIVALGDEQLAVSNLAVEPAQPQPVLAGDGFKQSLKAASQAASREAERELILKALARTRWNRKRAAQDLQISYKSLLSKLKQIGLKDSEIERGG